MSEPTVIRQCSHIGVSGTTKLFVRQTGCQFEARIGIALLGSTNMPLDELENSNPFDDNFQDNFAVGTGSTEAEALEDLMRDMNQTANSIWAI